MNTHPIQIITDVIGGVIEEIGLKIFIAGVGCTPDVVTASSGYLPPLLSGAAMNMQNLFSISENLVTLQHDPDAIFSVSVHGVKEVFIAPAIFMITDTLLSSRLDNKIVLDGAIHRWMSAREHWQPLLLNAQRVVN